MDEESEKIAALIKSLSHPDKKVIREGADALISIAAFTPQLAERLRRLLDEAPVEKRWPIAYVLAHIAPLSASCLDVLKDTLESSDPDIRWAAALLLVRLAKNSSPDVVVHLAALVNSGRPTQRRMAVYCLRDIGAQDSASRRALLDAMGDPEPLVRVAAVTSLKALPEIGAAALDRLLRLFLADPDSRVRVSAALSLGHLAAPTEEIRAVLKDASLDPDSRLSKAARVALALLEKKGPAYSTK